MPSPLSFNVVSLSLKMNLRTFSRLLSRAQPRNNSLAQLDLSGLPRCAGDSLVFKLKKISRNVKSFLQSTYIRQCSTVGTAPLSNTSSTADPLQYQDYFGVQSLFSVEDLFKARIHLGHKQGLRNDFMIPYIYGNRMGVDIIDLDQTAEHLKLALNVIAHLSYKGGMTLFLCRNRQHAITVENMAKACGEYAHCRYWSGGLFTNSTLQYQSVTRLPDCCVFLGTQNNIFAQHKAVTEATKLNIITVGVVDTNCDPRLITYPIPGNDDSPASIQLFCRLFKEAVLLGKQKKQEHEKNEDENNLLLESVDDTLHKQKH